MSVSFGGFNSNCVTFKTAVELKNGCAVKISESDTVAACADGESFCGFVMNADNGYACVQLSGAVKVKYSGNTPVLGYETLACDGEGVKVSENGREYLVVAVDENNETVTFLM